MILLFRYKDAEYKVTDDTGTRMKDYRTLLETGRKITMQHDNTGEKISFDQLEFSYQSFSQNGRRFKIFSDESLSTAIEEIRYTAEELN